MAEVLAHVVRDPSIYQAGGELVHTVVDEVRSKHLRLAEKALCVRELSMGALRSIICEHVDLYEPRDDGEKPLAPPEWLLRGLLELHEWKAARSLMGIVSTPVLRSDGTIHSEPGYDALTGLLLEPGCRPPVIDHPSQEDARAAGRKLLEVVKHFPFKSDAHSSVFLSGVLTLCARAAIDGAVPLHYIEANTRGAGKSLLSDIIALIATGRPAPRMVDAKDDDEWRKRILAIAISGTPLVLIDNVRGKLQSAALDAAITSELWEDRLLNQSKLNGAVPIRNLWIVTGNNAEIGGDLGRRMLLCRLESPHEHPEERTDVAGEDALKAEVRARRAELVGAALTMLRAWWAAGKPRARLRPFLGFQSWSDIVRQVIAFAGFADPGETLAEVRDIVDQETLTLRDLLKCWEGLNGNEWVNLGEVVKLCWPKDSEVPASARPLREQLEEHTPLKSAGAPRANALGRRLGQYVGRIADLRMLERRRDPLSKGGWHWRVISVEPQSTARLGDGYDDRDWSTETDPNDRTEET